MGNEGGGLSVEPNEKERLTQFIKLEMELQYHQGRSGISGELLLAFLQSDEGKQLEKIRWLESWLNASWRRGERPSQIDYSELMQRVAEQGEG
jgi:hypothetical protein